MFSQLRKCSSDTKEYAGSTGQGSHLCEALLLDGNDFAAVGRLAVLVPRVQQQQALAAVDDTQRPGVIHGHLDMQVLDMQLHGTADSLSGRSCRV